MKTKRIHQVYGWITAVFLVVAGICLINACVGIYQLGDRPFSPETVAVAFSKICVPVYICLGLILGGWLLQLCCPAETKKTTTPFYPMQLARLQAKLSPEQLAASPLKNEILALRRKRMIHNTITLVLLVICSGVFLSYGLNPANFHQSEINQSMAAAMLLFFPCLAVPFGYGCFAAFYGLKLTRQEIPLLRQALHEAAPHTPEETKSRSLVWLRVALLCVGIFLLAYGFYTGGTADVLTKAINICTECVGLG